MEHNLNVSWYQGTPKVDVYNRIQQRNSGFGIILIIYKHLLLNKIRFY